MVAESASNALLFRTEKVGRELGDVKHVFEAPSNLFYLASHNKRISFVLRVKTCFTCLLFKYNIEYCIAAVPMIMLFSLAQVFHLSPRSVPK